MDTIQIFPRPPKNRKTYKIEFWELNGGSRQGFNTVGITLNNHIFSYKGDAVLLIFIWIGHFIFPVCRCSFENCFCIYFTFLRHLRVFNLSRKFPIPDCNNPEAKLKKFGLRAIIWIRKFWFGFQVCIFSYIFGFQILKIWLRLNWHGGNPSRLSSEKENMAKRLHAISMCCVGKVPASIHCVVSLIKYLETCWYNYFIFSIYLKLLKTSWK